MTEWARRIRRTPGAQELEELRDAAKDLANQTKRVPSKGRVVFQTVADCAVIGTVVIGGVMASIHLYRTLFPKPHEGHSHRSPEPSDQGREPPHRRPRGVIADDPDHARSR